MRRTTAISSPSPKRTSSRAGVARVARTLTGRMCTPRTRTRWRMMRTTTRTTRPLAMTMSRCATKPPALGNKVLMTWELPCGIGAIWVLGRLSYVSLSLGTQTLLLSRSRDIGDDNDSMKPALIRDPVPYISCTRLYLHHVQMTDGS